MVQEGISRFVVFLIMKIQTWYCTVDTVDAMHTVDLAMLTYCIVDTIMIDC